MMMMTMETKREDEDDGEGGGNAEDGNTNGDDCVAYDGVDDEDLNQKYT